MLQRQRALMNHSVSCYDIDLKLYYGIQRILRYKIIVCAYDYL